MQKDKREQNTHDRYRFNATLTAIIATEWLHRPFQSFHLIGLIVK